MSTRKSPRGQNGKKIGKPNTALSTKKERTRGERKASVRKERFEELDSESDLTDVPSDEDDDAGPSRSRLDKGKGKGSDSLDSDSDTEMERKLAEAGDGESLLGSGISGEDTEEEEERYIIQDASSRESKSYNRHRDSSDRKRHGDESDWASKNDTEHRARSNAIRSVDTNNSQAEDAGDGHSIDQELLSLSPNSRRMFGLPVIDDEIFEEQDAFNSSSEPSFTDFFESSSGSDSDELAAILGDVEDDDDEFTTDSDEDHDISDLDDGGLDAPLIAHLGRTPATDGENINPVELRPEMPLLVIEDLDGRLIYARAGDGEAVFGSDGEFEFVDDSDDNSADWEFDAGGNRLLPGSNPILAMENDDGDTTDELPDEDMPYPRLLVGSVAPHGGRNARRARAMAAQSRRLSPAVTSALPSPSAAQKEQPLFDVPSAVTPSSTTTSASGSRSSPNSAEGVNTSSGIGITISTEDLARDPEGTLKAAAAALGVTVEEAASLVAGVQIPDVQSMTRDNLSSNESAQPAASLVSAEKQRASSPAKPPMGSFMPTSAKSVHRAVIDGSNKAPSPFSGKRSLERKGLAKKRTSARRSSLMQSLNSKRLRRFSSANDAASAFDDLSEVTPSSPEPVQVDPMELDDVVDADMFWRGTASKSPSPELVGMASDQEVDLFKRRDSVRGKRRSSISTPSATTAPGLNLNAFARWHKVPMGSFRDSQISPAQPQNAFQPKQPLGTYLLTRSQGSSANKRNSSPFRSSSNAARHPEMFSISPLRPSPQDGDTDLTLGGNPNSRTRSFIISPVLFPTRGGGPMAPTNKATLPSLDQMTGLSSKAETGSVASNSAGPGRITRREKRERRARRAAIITSGPATGTPLMDANGVRQESKSPLPTTPRLQTSALAAVVHDDSDSPATALPRMRITDATPTPRGSPGPNGHVTGKDLLQGRPETLTTGQSKLSLSSESDMNESSALEQSSDPIGHPTTDEEMPNSTSHQTSNEVSGGLPSSVCKAPLHSPLFGGIFGGAFSYDLDEKESEQLRI